MKPNTCSTCLWYFTDNSWVYECRKNAPVVVRPDGQRAFPRIGPGDFCGDWAPAEGVQEKLELDMTLSEKVPTRFLIWSNEINAWFRENCGSGHWALGPIQSRFDR